MKNEKMEKATSNVMAGPRSGAALRPVRICKTAFSDSAP
jgi:hypothetical protein